MTKPPRQPGLHAPRTRVYEVARAACGADEPEHRAAASFGSAQTVRAPPAPLPPLPPASQALPWRVLPAPGPLPPPHAPCCCAPSTRAQHAASAQWPLPSALRPPQPSLPPRPSPWRIVPRASSPSDKTGSRSSGRTSEARCTHRSRRRTSCCSTSCLNVGRRPPARATYRLSQGRQNRPTSTSESGSKPLQQSEIWRWRPDRPDNDRGDA